MGSIDPGPHYLGSGQIATSDIMTRRDLGLVLRGARALDVPLLLGTAGCAGARPHLDTTLDMVRTIAAEEDLHFRLAVIGRRHSRRHREGRTTGEPPAVPRQDGDAERR